MNAISKNCEERMGKILEVLGRDLAAIRTGKAHPSALDSVKVAAWGSEMPLAEVAAITVEDARTLKVVPHDKNLAAAIEKAILMSDLDLNPSSAGTTIRVPMPALTEETRKNSAKQASEVVENARESVRKVQRDSLAEPHCEADEVNKLADKFMAEIDTALKAKEKDLMAV